MGLFKKYVNQTRKPEGFLGKLMIDGMKCHTVEELSSALKASGFSSITVDRYPNKSWITAVAEK